MQKKNEIGYLGKNLIFLISQPRSGSTLLQKILGSHLKIHTISEPWLMLHPFYALRHTGYQAEYGHRQAVSALENFLLTFPEGKNHYFEGIRRMYGFLYGSALKNSGKPYFLDKTPRYYLIILELYHTFPDAHFIILYRNPIAVLCSIIETWVKKDWYLLYEYKNDLIRAPRLLIEGAAFLEDRCITVHYEQYVQNPKLEIQRICNMLGVEFKEEMIEYKNHKHTRWEFGDQESVYKHMRPNPENVGKWANMLSDPQVWRLVRDYLPMLGKDTIEELGYPYEELVETVRKLRPHHSKPRLVAPLSFLLREPVRKQKFWGRSILPLIMSLRWRGLRGTALAVMKGALNAVSRFG